jgi:hypothetical protein
MIPKEWLRKKVTIKEVMEIRRVDLLPLPVGSTAESIVDKGDKWWNQPVFASRPDFLMFLSSVKGDEELYYFSSPALPGASMNGYAKVRNDEVTGMWKV